MDNFSDWLTFEGARGQTDDTRSTFRVPLKTLGCDGSNSRMWEVGGIEIKGTRARYFFGGYGQGNQ